MQRSKQQEKISAGLRLAWARRKGPWSCRVRKRKNGGEETVLVFQKIGGGAKDELFISRWYPPWQNDLMRENARLIVADLNHCFLERNGASKS